MTAPRGISGAVDLAAIKQRAEAQAAQQARAAAGQQPAGAPGGADSASIIDVTEASFQADVVERSMQQLVLVDLWAEWCGPCKQLTPVLERLAEQSGGAWVLAKVDVDANPRIAQLFGAQSIPTVVAIAGGQPVDAFSGALPEPEVRQFLDRLLTALKDKLPGVQAAAEEGAVPEPPPDPRFVEAEEAVERGDFAAAAAMYERVLADEPANEQAQAALTQVKFLARSTEADPSAVQRADADPTNVTAAIEAADFEVASDRPEDAFARLIAGIRRSSGEDRDRLRAHLVELFGLFDPADPRVAQARRDLASALY